MTQPLIAWDMPDDTRCPNLIWRGKLENRYLVEVHRTDDSTGKLCVFDHQKNDAFIASWVVSLLYGAQFGPDAEDVEEWQSQVDNFIDGRVKEAI